MKKGKTLKTLQKRIKLSKNGKVMKKDVNTGHLKVKWSANKKFRKKGYSSQPNKGHTRIFKKLLPGANIK